MKKSSTLGLKSYLTIFAGCALLASMTQAAVVQIDISSVDGPNAGLSTNGIGGWDLIGPGNHVFLENGDGDRRGIMPEWAGFLNFQMSASGLYKFAAGEMINATGNWASDFNFSGNFQNGIDLQPAWDVASYVGFQADSNGIPLYGWLEVTWNGVDTFEILGGAYEDGGAPLAAGGLVVPEPSALVLLATGGALAARRRRRVM